uniref:Vesicle-associated membrane protein 2 n=1 Tax=Amphilophus citrinellus TaxID=61819 RepID=A0A3Q0S991_AMPCI
MSLHSCVDSFLLDHRKHLCPIDFLVTCELFYFLGGYALYYTEYLHFILFFIIRSAPAAGAPAPEGGNQPPPNLTSNRRLQQTQAQVDEVVDIMRVNVDKVLERDQKLSELDDRADALQAGASQFETSAAKLKNKYWWKNAKMMIILGVICVIVLIVIIGKNSYFSGSFAVHIHFWLN